MSGALSVNPDMCHSSGLVSIFPLQCMPVARQPQLLCLLAITGRKDAAKLVFQAWASMRYPYSLVTRQHDSESKKQGLQEFSLSSYQ